jgi:hypothetical protein
MELQHKPSPSRARRRCGVLFIRTSKYLFYLHAVISDDVKGTDEDDEMRNSLFALIFIVSIITIIIFFF